MEWQFWFALVGFFGFAISLWIGGLVQGAMWTQGVPFLEGVRAQAPYYFIRMISGVLMLISVILFAYNVYLTWQNKPEAAEAGQAQPAAAAV
jgi:cytochrome c oxidase cbb3-type subunit 1